VFLAFWFDAHWYDIQTTAKSAIIESTIIISTREKAFLFCFIKLYFIG
jgi:hypothetical protein